MIPKVGIITQARMTSTRLPGKILKEAGGKTLLAHHIERLKWSALPIFIATTINKTDDVVCDWAENNEIKYFRGDEENVLSRYYNCSVKHNLDVIIRVTSDCPLIDGYSLRQAVDKYLLKGDTNLYLLNSLKRSFPRGFDFEIFSFKALKDAYINAVLCADLEHVTPYIRENRSGKIQIENIEYKDDRSFIRITVDTPEDFALVKLLIERYQAQSMRDYEIIRIFDQNPDLLTINAHIKQKKI